MLKFFRLIRKRLLQESKITRYLAYAAGEIILVVVGILIALQVNNRNENRRQEKEENKILIRMVDELDQNVARMVYIDTVRYLGPSLEETVAFFDSVKILMADGLTTSEVGYLCSGTVTRFFHLNLNTDLFEEMKNRGLFYNLRSPALASSIQAYYQKVQRETQYIDDIHNQIRQEIEANRYGFLKFREAYERLGLEAIKSNQWVFDPNSNHFYDLKRYVDRSASQLGSSRSKIYAIADESQKLKQEIFAYLQGKR